MTDIPTIETGVIPAGTYTIGDDARVTSRPQHEIVFAGGAIAVTAVTNAAFKPFVTGDGYTNATYWTDMGWRWQKNRQERTPAFWDDPTFNHPLQPVVGVTWYEAVAYANWLAQMTDLPWQLPSEAAWEIAAHPPEDKPSSPPSHQVNTAELGIRRTWAAMGRGQTSWCGARDLLGNVWEWTTSRWGRNWQSLDYTYPYQPDDDREDQTGSYARVMRGGSWFDRQSDATPAHRGRYLPGSRGSNIGFRLFHPE